MFILAILIVNLCNSEKLYFGALELSLIILIFIVWLDFKLDGFEILGLRWLKSNDDKDASKKVPLEEIDQKYEFEVKYKTKELKEIEKENPKVIDFYARINYDKEAGSQALLRIKINEILIDQDRLFNKPKRKKYIDNREFEWFNEDFKSWNIQYSPDFSSNYFSEKYKIINGDPYHFAINISDIKTINGKYKIEFEHIGLTGQEPFQNSIIIRNLQLL